VLRALRAYPVNGKVASGQIFASAFKASRGQNDCRDATDKQLSALTDNFNILQRFPADFDFGGFGNLGQRIIG
jgi:hypothetical protein